MKKTITILTPTYNEEDNIDELYNRISKVAAKNSHYNFEHLFIDNASNDKSIEKIKQIAKKDKKVKLIVNARNFGADASIMHGVTQCKTDACIYMVSDLQDPPELISDLIKKWEEGFKIVGLVKTESEEIKIMFILRKLYYRLLTNISEVPPVENYAGSGLMDRDVIKILRDINDPVPFLRGLLAEIGFPMGIVYFKQLQRKRGSSANGFLQLYQVALEGITNHSKFPIKLLSIFGFILSVLSFILAISYLCLKLFYWDDYNIGMTSLLIGIFFFGSIQMFFLGIIGEYISVIHTRVRKMPSVVELERVNF
tara:strand:- start:329 stop:1261 length:933 start_codon:yes stop_codon:yes gene_type:complete